MWSYAMDGLNLRWRLKIGVNPTGQYTIVWPASDTDEILRSASGEFDNNESNETVAKVRASKSTILQGTGLTGVQPSHLASYAAKAGSTAYILLALWTEIMQCYYLFYKLDD